MFPIVAWSSVVLLRATSMSRMLRKNDCVPAGTTGNLHSFAVLAGGRFAFIREGDPPHGEIEIRQDWHSLANAAASSRPR